MVRVPGQSFSRPLPVPDAVRNRIRPPRATLSLPHDVLSEKDAHRREGDMSGFGTDIVALACIVGSAATSGAATLAFLDGDNSSPADCAVETMSVSPNLVVSGIGGHHAVVMATPRVRVESAGDCRQVIGERVRVDLERVRRDMDRARIQIEVARAQAEEARDAVRVIRIQGDEARVLREDAMERVKEAQVEVQEALEKAQEARAEALERARQQLEAQLKEVKKGSGGLMN